MRIVNIIAILLLVAPGVCAVDYPALNANWNLSLGGDLLDIRDVDGDGNLDITVSLLRPPGSYAYHLNKHGQLIWRNKISVIWPENTPYSIMVDDIDQNGNTDIVVGSVIEAKSCFGQLSPFSNPIFMLERNPEVENNMLKWVNRGYGYTLDIQAADLTGDSKKEIVTGTREGQVFVLNSEGDVIWKYKTEGSVNKVWVDDLNRDNVPEVLAGSYENIYLLNKLGNTIWRYKTNSPVLEVTASNINSDNLKEVIAITEDERLIVLSAGGHHLWNYSLSGLKPTLTVADVDGDGQNEIIVASRDFLYGIDNSQKIRWRYEVGYPIIKIFAAPFDFEDKWDLIVLGARKLESYSINPRFIDDRTANEHLEIAKQKLEDKDYVDAISNAQTAKGLYEGLGDGVSVDKTQRINQTAALYLQADGLYRDALGNYSVERYQEAKEMAVEAERIYIELKDANSTENALNLANEAIDQLDAFTFYTRALDYFRAQQYLEASLYAKKSLDMYTFLNDTEKIERSLKLVENNTEFPKANNNYKNSQKQLEVMNLSYALELANKSKQSYEIVGDVSRIDSAQKLIDEILHSMDVQRQNNTGNVYLKSATTKYEQKNYHGCLIDLEPADPIYQNITESYMLGQTQLLRQRCQRGVEAQQHLAKANEFFLANDYEIAVDYAAKARQLFRTNDDIDGALKASKLIEEMKDEQTHVKNVEVRSTQDELDILTYGLAAIIIILAVILFVLILIWLRRSKKGAKKEKAQEAKNEEDLSQMINFGGDGMNPLEKFTNTPLPRGEDQSIGGFGTSKSPEDNLSVKEPLTDLGDQIEKLMEKVGMEDTKTLDIGGGDEPSDEGIDLDASMETDETEVKSMPEKTETVKKPAIRLKSGDKANVLLSDEIKTADAIKKELDEIDKKLKKSKR